MGRRPPVQVAVVGSLSAHQAAWWAQLLKVEDAYNAFPPLALRPLTPLAPLTSRGLRGAITNCTQIANPPPRFLTRSCLFSCPALHLGVYERLHLERGIDRDCVDEQAIEKVRQVVTPCFPQRGAKYLPVMPTAYTGTIAAPCQHHRRLRNKQRLGFEA